MSKPSLRVKRVSDRLDKTPHSISACHIWIVTVRGPGETDGEAISDHFLTSSDTL